MLKSKNVDSISDALIKLTGTNDVRLYISLIEMMNDGVMIVDNEERVIFVNYRFCAITGYSKSELIGKVAAEILVAKKVKSTMDEKVQERAYGISESYEVEVIRKSGDKAWLRISGSPIYDVKGEVVGSIGLHADITLEKVKERSLNQSLSKEKELNKLKSQFITTASHEFRTPLSIIQSNVELMCMQIAKKMPEEKSNFSVYFDRVKNEIENMSELMDQVLMIDKINSGKIESNRMAIDLVATCKQVALKMKSASEARSLDIHVSGNPIMLKTDLQLFEQVILNLTSNAFKFSENSNPILHLFFNQKNIGVHIIDDGIGIPEKDQSALFQPFYRASNAVDIPGTGLGLSIVKNIMHNLKGKVEIESKQGIGTKVMLLFPLPKEENGIFSDELRRAFYL
ncbi:PAS domain-containing sensor histidine kinase [Flavobacteriales bacterium]|nr:PAS domain-containing sensor histidine kinase [Flavobacteriales bacterium]